MSFSRMPLRWFKRKSRTSSSIYSSLANSYRSLKSPDFGFPTTGVVGLRFLLIIVPSNNYPPFYPTQTRTRPARARHSESEAGLPEFRVRSWREREYPAFRFSMDQRHRGQLF